MSVEVVTLINLPLLQNRPGCYNYSNELTKSIERGISGLVNLLLASQDGFCTMELVLVLSTGKSNITGKEKVDTTSYFR
jgi:hypothetical protein